MRPKAKVLAQFGLDDPAATRYFRWLMGSDRQAMRLIGNQLTRIRNENGRISCWAVDDDGTLYKNYVDAEGQIMRHERQLDGSIRETQSEADQWQVDGDGTVYFWGVTIEDQAAMWIQDDTPTGLLFRSQRWTAVPNSRLFTLAARHFKRGSRRFYEVKSTYLNRTI